MNIDAQMRLAHDILTAPVTRDERDGMYGYCPVCREVGVSRERRPDGNDRCKRGHSYPSRSSINTPTGWMEPI